MRPSLKAGLLVGLRKAVVPFGLALICLLASMWAIDDLYSLLRALAWVLVAIGILLIVGNVLRAREHDEPLEFRHGGFDDNDPAG